MGSAVVESIIIMKHFLVFSCLVVLIINQNSASAAMMPGGLSDVQATNPAMQYVIDQVHIEDCPDYKAISFKYQYVAGFNYYVKVQCDGDNHVHLRVHTDFSGNVSLEGVQTDKSATDEIAAFRGLGGLNGVQTANPAIQYVIEQVRSEVKDCPDYKAINYKTQFVAGINYYVKVQCDGDNHVHLRVHTDFSGIVSLEVVQTDKSATDEIAAFRGLGGLNGVQTANPAIQYVIEQVRSEVK